MPTRKPSSPRSPKRAAARAKPAVPPKEVGAAAQRADVRALEKLLARGADLNASYRNYRPLHAAIQSEPHAEGNEHGTADSEARAACVAWLLDHGADPELGGAWPTASALIVACLSGESKIAALLVDRGARRDALALAALGEVAALKKLLARDKELANARNESDLTPLHCAAGSRLSVSKGETTDRTHERAQCAAIELLLENGAHANAIAHSWSSDVDPAYFAIGRPLRRLELLLDAGADATNALRSAAWHADPSWLDLCLARGGKPDRALEKGRPVLNELVRWGQIEPALRLLARGASPNVADERGWTAVHQAVSRGNERMLAALLDAGGDREARDASGLVPSDYARVLRKPKLVELLAAPRPTARSSRRS